MTAGSLIWELETFIESVITPELNLADEEDPNEPGLSLTFQAFAYSISGFLNEYKAILSNIEKDLQKQGIISMYCQSFYTETCTKDFY